MIFGAKLQSLTHLQLSSRDPLSTGYNMLQYPQRLGDNAVYDKMLM
jgi:hypothetical protein